MMHFILCHIYLMNRNHLILSNLVFHRVDFPQVFLVLPSPLLVILNRCFKVVRWSILSIKRIDLVFGPGKLTCCSWTISDSKGRQGVMT